MDAVIRTEGLTKVFGKTRALSSLSLEVAAGEVFGYLGPNGAGKTTTIRLLLGMIRATSGRAEIFGVDCQRHPVRGAPAAGVRARRGQLVAVPDREPRPWTCSAASRAARTCLPRRS